VRFYTMPVIFLVLVCGGLYLPGDARRLPVWPSEVKVARFRCPAELSAQGMKREAGAWCAITPQGRRCPRNGKRVFRAVIRHCAQKPIGLQHGKAPRKASGNRMPLVSPETGLNNSWWLAVGETEQSCLAILPARCSVFPPARLQLIGHMSRARVRGRGTTVKKTLLAAALLSCTMTAHAADQSGAENLGSVIVTATRTAITADEALSSVTVITRADIERLQPLSVQDLLTGLPGVSFANSGGLGQQTSLFMRGSNSSHTLVLIDGVRIGSVGNGLAAFEQLPVEQIERIEVVRGPRSSLYGADAIGGVIQIFTRHGSRDGGLLPSFSVTTGSDNLLRGQAGLSGGSDHAWYNLSVGAQYTRGINACRIGAKAAFAGCFTDEPDRDGYRNENLSANGGYRWDDGAELSGTWLRSLGDIKFDGSYQNRSRTTQQVAGSSFSINPLEAWKSTLSVGQNLDRYDNYENQSFVGYIYSRRNQASWQNDISLSADQLLTLGIDWQGEQIDSDTGFLATRRNNTGGYVQYQGTFGRNEVELSARRDHNQQFGNHNTGAAAWGYHFDGGLKLSASYGSAFHAPTFNDLYYPYGSGNPYLKPEQSRSVELGLSQQLDQWNWAVNTYQTRIDQLIALDSNYFPSNISKARIRGVEGQLGTTLAGWKLQSYLTWLQPQNRDGGRNDGHVLPRRPEHTARVDLDRRFGEYGLGATVYGAGRSYDDAANQHPVGGYSTTDLRASYHFAPDWQVEARLANVFDRRYETVRYFNQPGRSGFLTLRYSPTAH
jgi:vitamin B12 transporter